MVEKSVGERLRELRVSKKLSIKCLAEVFGVSINTIYNLENNKSKIKISLLVLYVTFFSVRADYILGLSENKCRKNSPDKSNLDDC